MTSHPGKRGPKCPVCGKPATVETAPFCSPRCKDVDLARWFSGGYRIPTEEQGTPEADVIPHPALRARKQDS